MTGAMSLITHFFCGDALMTMIINLSQAPCNGWETWFSLNYGRNLSKLEINVKKVKPENFIKYKK